MNKRRNMVIGLAACAAMFIVADTASAQGFGVGVGAYRPGGISIGVGYGYPYGYGLGYPGYYGYYPGVRPYYGYGYTGYYPSYRYYNYYTPRVIVPTYVPTYSVPNYSVPAYSSGTAVTQAAYQAPSNAAMITVNVPAEAEIWFSGDKTSQTGTRRRFETPPLEPGSNYSYVVRARWTENGKERDETKKVAVHANDRITVDFP